MSRALWVATGIPVDPYYLTHKAEEVGYQPDVILAGRRINDRMGIYVAQELVKLLSGAGKSVQEAKVLVLGVTFKENVRDIRNTRVVELVRELETHGAHVWVHDPLADGDRVREVLRTAVVPDPFQAGQRYDALVLAVPHREFQSKGVRPYLGLLETEGGPGVLVDVKGVLSRRSVERAGAVYWSP